MPNEIDAFVAAFDDAHERFHTRHLIKETAEEVTELVECSDGTPAIRKYIEWPYAEPHPYERICGMTLPHIPRVFETERVGEVLVVVTEYLAGETLEAAVKRGGPLGESGAGMLLKHLCEALSALHGLAGGPIIHRDVNPANIILTPEGAHLIDFGIARSWREGAPSDTRLLGTEGYTPPEQFGFRQTDERADIYALGQTMRFALTGYGPEARARAPQPWQESVIARATALDPDARFHSVEDFLGAYNSRSVSLRARLHSFVGRHGLLPLRGVTSRNKTLYVLWQIWRVAFTVYTVFALLICAYGLLNAKTESDVIAFATVALFWTIAPYLILVNPFGVTNKIAWLQTHRYIKLFGLLVLSFAASIIFVIFSLGFIVAALD